MKMKTVITALSASHESRAAEKIPKNVKMFEKCAREWSNTILKEFPSFNYGESLP